MDKRALFSLSYGLFMVSAAASTSGGDPNGCIINTCIQASSDPLRLALSCISANYTTELISRSGRFNISVLDSSAPFSLISRFGMQSGREVKKFDGFEHALDGDGIPYLQLHACAMFACKVSGSIDLKSHILFIADILEAKTLSNVPPMTYDLYRSSVKPKTQKPAEQRKIKGWRCRICGYFYEGESLPADYLCPLCAHPVDDFEPVYA